MKQSYIPSLTCPQLRTPEDGFRDMGPNGTISPLQKFPSAFCDIHAIKIRLHKPMETLLTDVPPKLESEAVAPPEDCQTCLECHEVHFHVSSH
jgi:hypothetical protein